MPGSGDVPYQIPGQGDPAIPQNLFASICPVAVDNRFTGKIENGIEGDVGSPCVQTGDGMYPGAALLRNGFRCAAQNCQVVAFRQQCLAEMSADQTRTTGEQDTHLGIIRKMDACRLAKLWRARKPQKPL